jgi:hypothetical protein
MDLSSTAHHYTVVVLLGVMFVLLGAAMAFDVHGFGRLAVRLMFSRSRYRSRGLGHQRFFYVGCGLMIGAFGMFALLVGVLH